MEDSRIVELYVRRSEMAIAATKEKYGVYCNSIASRILAQPQDAEECVSDAYLRVWNSIPPNNPCCLKTYLGKIVRNTALIYLRKQGSMKRGGGTVIDSLEELEECVGNKYTLEDIIEQGRLAACINRFLQELPQEKRVAFVLRYWYLYSTKEAAAKMGISDAKLRTMLFRLRKDLKEFLEQEGIAL